MDIQRYLFDFDHKESKITAYFCTEYGEGSTRHHGCRKVAEFTFDADIPSKRAGGGGSPYYDYNNNIHVVSGGLDEAAFAALVAKFSNWCDISNGFIWVDK